MTVSPEQSKRIHDLINTVYAPDSGMEKIETLLSDVSAILEVEYNGIHLLPNRLVTETFGAGNNPEDFIQAYSSELFFHDFLFQTIECSRSSVQISSLLSPEIKKHDFFYNECQKIRPAGDGWYLPVTDGVVIAGCAAFCRAGRDPPLCTENDNEVMNFLFPLLMEGIRRACLPMMNRAAAWSSDIIGTAYLDGCGSVVDRNDRAGWILRELFGERYREQPQLSLSRNGEIFQNRVVRFLSGEPHPDNGEFILYTTEGRVVCRLHLLEAPAYRRYFLGAPQVLLTLDLQEKMGDAPEDDSVYVRLGLTDRETEVSSLLRAGHSNAEIGRLLGITEATVKRHLYNTFNKAGADSRTQLVYLLSRMAL